MPHNDRSNAPLVTAEWLKERTQAPDIKIVDASWIPPFLNPEKTGRELYETAHIPGAVYFDIDEIADTSSNLPHMMSDKDQFIQHMQKLGLGDGYRIVVYDQNRFCASARAWWMLRVMGHKDVVVLDGGLSAWVDAGGQTEDLLPNTIEPRQFTANRAPTLEKNITEMRMIVENASAQIIDARGEKRFTGEAPEPRKGLSSGHMPGALNLPSDKLIDAHGKLLPLEQLKAAFRATGADLEKPIVTTCGSGVTASILALALARIGREDVAVYDGSWSEWASSPDCPIEKN